MCVGASAGGVARRRCIGVCMSGGGIDDDDVIVDGGGVGQVTECLCEGV